METRKIDGKTFCLVSRTGEQSLWKQCQVSDTYQMSLNNSSFNPSGLIGLSVLAIAFLYLFQVIQSRKEYYLNAIEVANRSLSK